MLILLNDFFEQKDVFELFDFLEFESDDVLLSNLRLEYKLFWEFIRTYIFLFSFVISWSLFLRMLKYVFRWLYFLWLNAYRLIPWFFETFETIFFYWLDTIMWSKRTCSAFWRHLTDLCLMCFEVEGGNGHKALNLGGCNDEGCL